MALHDLAISNSHKVDMHVVAHQASPVLYGGISLDVRGTLSSADCSFSFHTPRTSHRARYITPRNTAYMRGEEKCTSASAQVRAHSKQA